jgi:predicted HicB family RNase H-like nuclease
MATKKKFNIRLNPQLQKEAKAEAAERDTTLEEYIAFAIYSALPPARRKRVQVAEK